MLWELSAARAEMPGLAGRRCWCSCGRGSLGMVPHMGRAPLSFPALGTHPHSWGGRGSPTSTQGDTMHRSVLTGQGMRTGRERLAKAPRLARKGFIRALAAGAAAGIAFTTAGLAGGAAPAMAAPGSIGPPGYTENWAGYSVGGGRWFRFISTTLTVPAVTGMAVIGLSHGQPVGEPFAELEVLKEDGPGGGTVSVEAHVSPGGYGTLPLSPRAGDQLAISI